MFEKTVPSYGQENGCFTTQFLVKNFFSYFSKLALLLWHTFKMMVKKQSFYAYLHFMFSAFLSVYDMPYSKPSIPAITPKSPMVPQRVSSLNRSVPTHGRQNESDKGPYSSFLTQIANQPLREDVSS